MTTFETPRQAYVWIWLPGKTSPVVAGRLHAESEFFVFTYGRSYLARQDAIPVYLPELPLRSGAIAPEPPLEMANALRDASPDAWGRRCVTYRLAGVAGGQSAAIDLDELSFLLRSGSDRIGALDFQHLSTEYVPRDAENSTLEQMLEAVDCVSDGKQLQPDLADALLHGTSIGGARPKALVQDGDKKYIAKFSTSKDHMNFVKSEYVAMRLAEMVGLDVARVKLVDVNGRDVLLVERFDRVLVHEGWERIAIVSALTLLGLNERMARHASYETLADIVRARFRDPTATLRELFGRMTFNVLVGNTDDHARNHAAFWDGEMLALTPAYDICPQSRVGREASQAMQVHGFERRSQLSLCLAAASKFLLRRDHALSIMRHQVSVIKENWDAVCCDAELGHADRNYFWRRQFLNDLAFEGLENELSALIA